MMFLFAVNKTRIVREICHLIVLLLTKHLLKKFLYSMFITKAHLSSFEIKVKLVEIKEITTFIHQVCKLNDFAVKCLPNRHCLKIYRYSKKRLLFSKLVVIWHFNHLKLPAEGKCVKNIQNLI